MSRRFSSLLPTAILVTTALLPTWSAAQTAPENGGSKGDSNKTTTSAASTATATASGGSQGYGSSQGGGGGHAVGAETVVCPGGCYGGGRIRNYCHDVYSGAGYYGFFRRYYGYPFYGPSHPIASQGFDGGCNPVSGIVYSSGCDPHGAGVGGYGLYPLAGGFGASVSPQAMDSSGAPAKAPTTPPAKEPPPTNNAARLQLLVPEKAEVLIEDSKTTKKGAMREFVSPPLAPGKSFIYKITIRYTDANGAAIDEQHSIRVHANDRLRMDFTQTASPSRQEQEAISARK